MIEKWGYPLEIIEPEPMTAEYNFLDSSSLGPLKDVK